MHARLHNGMHGSAFWLSVRRMQQQVSDPRRRLMTEYNDRQTQRQWKPTTQTDR